jgi:hypothetical protein
MNEGRLTEAGREYLKERVQQPAMTHDEYMRRLRAFDAAVKIADSGELPQTTIMRATAFADWLGVEPERDPDDPLRGFSVSGST